MNKNRHLFLLGVGIVAPLVAFAQEDASRIEKRFEKPPEPKSSLQPAIFPIDEKLPPEKAGELRFTLKELSIKGNTAFSAAELALRQPIQSKIKSSFHACKSGLARTKPAWFFPLYAGCFADKATWHW